MKVKFSQFIFALLICFSFCSFAFGQEKPVALKFWQYSEKNGANLDELTNKTKQFAKKLKKLPKSTKELVNVYTKLYEVKCFSEKSTTAAEREKYVFDLLTKKFKVPKERLIFDSGRQRNETEIEFWLLPKDAARADFS